MSNKLTIYLLPNIIALYPLSQCCEGGVISPATCPYITEWLDDKGTAPGPEEMAIGLNSGNIGPALNNAFGNNALKQKGKGDALSW